MDFELKYQLPVFVEFFCRYKFPDDKSHYNANVAFTYYTYAYHQLITYTETYVSLFKMSNPSNDEVLYISRKAWSYALSMYVMLRVALEALQHMRNMLGDKGQVIDSVQGVIDIANEVAKHPAFNSNQDSSAREPWSISVNGEFDIITWAEDGTSSILATRRPEGDFMIIHDYMESMAQKFLKEQKISA